MLLEIESLASVLLSLMLAYGLSSFIGRRIKGEAGAVARYIAIDGLRSFLALGVFLHHFPFFIATARGLGWRDPASTVLSSLGPVPVAAFFMITAVLFYGKLVTSRGKQNWVLLYKRRLMRLAPMYVIGVMIIVLVSFWHAGWAVNATSFENISAIACWTAFTACGSPDINGYPSTYLINAGVVWTLKYEWLFYFSLPVMAFAIRSHLGASRALRIAGLITLIFACWWLDRYTTRFVMAFALGALAFELSEIQDLKTVLGQRQTSVLSISAAATALCLPLESFGPLQLLLVFIAFIPITCGTTWWGVLATRAARLLGDASYSVYLLHGIVLHIAFNSFVDGRSPHVWLWMPVLASFISVIAICCYIWIERPFMALGRQPIVPTSKRLGPA